MEQITKDSNIQHLAGIVPIAGQPLDFKFPWEDCLLPINSDYLAIERAVYQCVLAGCETIWVVGHMGTQPLVRKRVGDTILDPITTQRYNAVDRMKQVSIYYVPIHPKDKLKRDCLGWSVLHGADTAYKVSLFISKWIAPERYFCSFPYGIVPDESLRENRKLISSNKKIIYKYQNMSVKDNLHIPFSFDAEDFFRCRDIVKHKQAEEWNMKKARYYDLATVFKGLDDSNSEVLELSWFHDISSWNGYTNYLLSDQSKIYNKPKNLFKGNRRKYDDRSGRKNIQQDSITSETSIKSAT